MNVTILRFLFLMMMVNASVVPAISQQLSLEDITCDSVVTFKAGRYPRNNFGRAVFGTHYRQEWRTPVSARVFNLRKAGLVVTKQGGSRQTVNLHLKDSLGREYVLRSISKDPGRALNKEFRQTFIAHILNDQSSAEHPYGAFTIAPMASAIGIYYTTPYLVYVPNDPAFGEYASVLADKPALFEIRPDGDLSHVENMGNAPDAKSTEKMFKEVYASNSARVDEKMFARCRLFDMLIGDWGRHEDQWRWARFETDSCIMYKPIPRDHDHAFFKTDGFLPSVATGSAGFRNIAGFKYSYENLRGLGMSAATLDRKILTSLSREEWIAQANYIHAHLTDSVIESAVHLMPENIYPISGEEIIAKLKSRRDKVQDVAERYYELLSKEVNVTGSDKPEYFEVIRTDGKTSVKIYSMGADNTKEKLLYDRTFLIDETEAVNLYGLGGDDVFEVSGKAKKGIKLSLIGGAGKDEFMNSSRMAEGRKKLIIYDTKDNPLTKDQTIRDFRSDNPKDSVDHFFNIFKYNYTGPYISVGYNPDDGVFVGPGIIRRTNTFRKYPFANRQMLGFKYAFSTSAFTVSYLGDFRLPSRRWHFLLQARYLGPQFVFNYFGFGNESQNVFDIDYYRVRGNRIQLTPSFYKDLSSSTKLGIGPHYDYFNGDRTPGRITSTNESAFENHVFDANHFVGLKGYLRVLNVDSLFYPGRGYKLLVSVLPSKQVNGSKQFVNTSADLSAFHTFKGLEFLTIALRVGGEFNVGDYFFYQAPNLGGTDNLRGYRRSRFYGDRSFYSNNEVRIRMFKFRNYLFSSDIGLIGFYDTGRVWSGENSHKWHRGYGPGIWIALFERILFSGTFGFSEDGTNVNVQYGFFF